MILSLPMTASAEGIGSVIKNAPAAPGAANSSTENSSNVVGGWAVGNKNNGNNGNGNNNGNAGNNKSESGSESESANELAAQSETAKAVTFSITPAKISLTKVGETSTITASYENAGDDAIVTWSTSDSEIASVEGGVVKAGSKAGTATITATLEWYDSEDTLHTMTKTSTVTVAFNNKYVLYYYALIPGQSESGNADSSWFGLGETYILGVEDPTGLTEGTIINNYVIGDTVKTLYPTITYKNQKFNYAAPGSAEEYLQGYYTLQPYRVTVSYGSNAGNNAYNDVTYTRTYHYDFTCVLNEKNIYSANFAVKYPESSSFETLTAYAQRVAAGTKESKLTKPGTSAVPATKTANGLTYSFDGWYTDSACTEKANFTGSVNSNTTYYGKYVPTNQYYTVEYYYDGVKDASLTEKKGPAAVGSVISAYTDKAKNGYTLASAGVPLTIGTDASANVIAVKYVKRSITYSVNYYLNGTETAVADAVSGRSKYGETVSGTLKTVSGYTAVDPTAETKTLVLKDGSTQINFYYYKNVTLKANSNTNARYDGTRKTVSGFTVDGTVSGYTADFSSVTVGAAGTYVGSYDAVFASDVKGSVDAGKHYIVTATENGVLVITDDNYEAAAKTHTGKDSGYKAGDTVTFKITVKNIANGNREVSVSEMAGVTFVAGDGYTVNSTDSTKASATLAAGAEVVFTAAHVITESDLKKGSFENTAAVTIGGKEYTVTDSIETENASAALAVTKTSEIKNAAGEKKTAAGLGDTITYVITVENTGNLTLENVVLTDELTGNTGDKAIALGTMKAGDKVEKTVTYTVTESDIDAGSVKNTAKAEGSWTDLSGTAQTAEAQDSVEDATEAKSAKLSVKKTSDVNGTVGLNETITYTVTVTNSGNVTIKDIVLTDKLTGNTDKNAISIGTLKPGEERNATVTYKVSEQDILAGSVTNVASVSGKTADGKNTAVTANGSCTDTTDAKKASLTVKKTAIVTDASGNEKNKDEKAALGDVIVYTITVTNNGNLTVTGIEIEDELTGNTVANTIKVGTLAPGKAAVKTVRYTVTEADILAGTVKNTATASGTGADRTDVEEDDTAETETETAEGKLSVTKTSDKAAADTVALNGTVNYTITVENTGNVTLTNVILEDVKTGMTGEDVIEIGTMAPGAKVEKKISYKAVEADILAGEIVNIAEASGKDPLNNTVKANGRAVVKTEAAKGSMEVTKTSDVAENKTSALGDTITYTITVKNTGNITLNNIQVTDVLTGNTGDRVLTIEKLAPGKSESVNAYYTVSEKDILAGTITNTAMASAEAADQTNVNGSASKTDTTDPRKAELTVTKVAAVYDKDGSEKTGDDIRAGLGEEICYTVTVKNTGNVTVKNITVADEKTGDVAIEVGTLLPGESKNVNTKNYTVTEQDILTGSIENVAVAAGKDPKNEDVSRQGNVITKTEKAEGSLKVTKTSVIADDAEKTIAENGDVVTYTLTVENNGNVTLTNVVLTDEMTGNTGSKAFEIGTMAPGEKVEKTATYTVGSDDILAGTLENTAEAEGTDPAQNTVQASAVKKDAVAQAKAALSISMKITGIADADGNDKTATGKAGLNDVITYEITVTNNGNVDLKDIEVTDILSGSMPGEIMLIDEETAEALKNIDKLAAGKSTTISGLTYETNEVDVLFGAVKNTAKAVAADPNGGEALVDTAEIEQPTEAANAEVTLTKTAVVIDGTTNAEKAPENDGTVKAAEGDVIRYTITAENIGNLTVTELTITDELVGKTGADAWKLEALAPAENKTFTADYTVTEADILKGSIVNTAQIEGSDPTGDEVGDEAENTVVTVEEEAKLSVTKSFEIEDGKETAELGDTIHYTILVTNTGNVTVKDITVEDELVDRAGDNAWTIESLAPGASETFEADYRVTSQDILNGGVSNTATANGTDGKDDVIDTASDTAEAEVEEVDGTYTVEKKISGTDEDGDGVYKIGETISYMITVKNTGNVTRENITVTDILTGAAGNVEFNTLYEVTDNTVLIPSLAPFAEVTIGVTYTVTEEDVNATILNAATAKADDDIEKVTDGDPETTPEVGAEVEKTYKLTIHYVYANGTKAAEDFTGAYLAGEVFETIVSPAIEGYLPDWATISVSEEGMPARDLEFTVTYIETLDSASRPTTATEESAEEEDTTPADTEAESTTASETAAESSENSTESEAASETAETGTGTEETESTAAAETTEAAQTTEAEQTTEAAQTTEEETIAETVEETAVEETEEILLAAGADEEVSKDAVISAGENEEYELVEIEDEETPAGSLELDKHKCCMLHALLMLISMILVIIFTDKSKKNRKEIRELREKMMGSGDQTKGE